jgi:hypothetical protein
MAVLFEKMQHPPQHHDAAAATPKRRSGALIDEHLVTRARQRQSAGESCYRATRNGNLHERIASGATDVFFMASPFDVSTGKTVRLSRKVGQAVCVPQRVTNCEP